MLLAQCVRPSTARIVATTTAVSAQRRAASSLSPRTVLKYSGKSYAGTLITLAAVGLYFFQDQREQFASETTHLLTSVDWTADLLKKRAHAYSVVARLPRDYAGEAVEANARAVPAHNMLKLSVFDKDLQMDLGDLESHLQDAKLSLAAWFDRTFDSKVARAIVEDATTKVSKEVREGLEQADRQRLPFARPDMGTRAFAWLIDSACIGLLATPFWGGPLYGAVASVAWLSRDYVFPLLPFLHASPGYHVLGLEKVHLATADAVRPATAADSPKPVDPSEMFKSELSGTLGHNTLRFLTWCSSAGLLSTVASAAWVGYATFNGLDATMAAWDKLCGVQVLHRADLDAFAATGVVPVRAPGSADAATSMVLGSDDKGGMQGKFDLNGTVTESTVRVTPGGGDGNPPATLVITWVRTAEHGKQERGEKVVELPSFVKIGK
ncbi:hypothetical protein BC828DRAFT_373022 [Blastocladiella britannica]|nr:hypothetical protein BC828DRAFT_373022 [Blastocladiella britannica]